MMAKSTLRTLFLAASGVMLLASCNESLQNVVSSSGDGSVHVAPRLASTSIIPSKTASVKAVLTSGNSSFQDSIAYPGGDSLVLKDVPKGAAYRLVLVGKTTASKVLWGADTTVASADSSVTLLSLFTVDSLAKPALQGGTTVTSLTVSKDTTVHLSTSSLAANQILYYSTGAGASVYDASSGISVSAGQTLKAWVVARLVSGVDSLISADTMAVAIKKNVSPTSTDTTLASLSVKTGKLTPSFSSNVTSYTDTIFLPTTSETITAVANAANATITGDGDVTGLGELMVGGSKVQTITVTNNGKSLTYKVTVVMAKATLPKYTLTTNAINGTVTLSPTGPTFDSGTSVTATAKAKDGYVFSGWSGASTGTSSTCTVKMTKDTTLTATFAQSVPTDTTLSALDVSSGTLSPSFSSKVTYYHDTISSTTTSLTITATPSITGVKLTGTGVVDVSALKVGDSVTKTITVTSNLSYTVVIVKKAAVVVTSTDTLLKSLSVKNGVLTPTFDSTVQSYTDSVASTATSETISATAWSSTATVSGTGVVDLSGVAAGGSKTDTITVTNGTKSLKYIVKIAKKASVVVTSTDTLLKSLSVKNGVLAPTFDSTVQSYTDSVASTATSETISATAWSSTATVSGTGVVNLSGVAAGGSKLDTITVTNGTKSLKYIVKIAKKASVTPTDTSTALSALSVSGTLAPSFDSTMLTYHDTVDSNATSETISATASSSKAAVSDTGSVDLSTLAAGDSVMQKVVVTNGTGTRTYTVVIVKRKGTTSGGTALALPAMSSVSAGTYQVTATCTSQTSFQCAGVACSVSSAGGTTYYSGSGYDFAWKSVVIPVGTTIIVTGNLNGMQCQ